MPLQVKLLLTTLRSIRIIATSTITYDDRQYLPDKEALRGDIARNGVIRKNEKSPLTAQYVSGDCDIQ